MKSVNEKRERMHLELSLAVSQFELTNKITICKPQKTKVNRSVRAKTKLVFGTTEPKNRPATMFDAILSV